MKYIFRCRWFIGHRNVAFFVASCLNSSLDLEKSWIQHSTAAVVAASAGALKIKSGLRLVFLSCYQSKSGCRRWKQHNEKPKKKKKLKKMRDYRIYISVKLDTLFMIIIYFFLPRWGEVIDPNHLRQQQQQWHHQHTHAPIKHMKIFTFGSTEHHARCLH